MTIDFLPQEILESIPARIQKVFQAIPDRPAIKMGERVLTFAGLNQISAAIAQALFAKLGDAPEPVAILSDHGLSAIPALLGVVRTGRPYAVLDPANPSGRQAAILDELGARLIIGDRLNETQARDLGGGRMQILIIEDEAAAAGPAPNVWTADISPQAPAAIFFTSGSTGAPKGVIRSHEMFLLAARTDAGLRKTGPGDRQSSLFRYSFGASVSDVFCGLLNGACIYPFDMQASGFGRLQTWLSEEAITILHAPVVYFRKFLETLAPGPNFPALRIVHLGGAAVYRRDFDQFCEKINPGCLLEHRFSASEAANIARSSLSCGAKFPGNVLPAGYATEGKQILILGDAGQTLAPGEIGEIAVRSAFLAPGYWGHPELTARAFQPDEHDPALRIYRTGDLGRINDDGLLEHLGRLDTQVKVRGYRLDLQEIEARLLEHPAIQGAAVLPEQLQGGDVRLLAYLLLRAADPPPISDLRGFLAGHLPDYMLPAAFIVVSELPLTPTGKVNARLLPPPPAGRPDLQNPYVAPHTPLERRLAELWAELLELEEIGIADNFFELGGQSLLAAQLGSRLERELGISIPLSDLMDAPTVAGLARRISPGNSYLGGGAQSLNQTDDRGISHG